MEVSLRDEVGKGGMTHLISCSYQEEILMNMNSEAGTQVTKHDGGISATLNHRDPTSSTPSSSKRHLTPAELLRQKLKKLGDELNEGEHGGQQP
ncbi:hypothetical protein L2E82_16246 [Cichorium intybus]|uniref:Uncharacterized protein n=1 Tax=Cichorium intybus TaxID=13427 RepID=A0ACB9F4I0_CICIN|nr:hypothetical protein L2E82_16246 [Cichorium intybus]